MPKVILGIDEVGRGPWAGPLVVGAVILGENFQKTPELQVYYEQFTDSKKLSATKRQELARVINETAAATGLGWVSSTEIDRYGLSAALKLAARRAVKQVLQSKVPFDEIIIDGTINLLADTPLESRVSLLKKADLLVKEVSAASIIAKVARDEYMIKLGNKYPGYGFEKHVGYGTAAHKAALEKYGICPEHRQSIKPIQTFSTLSSDQPVQKLGHNTTKIGRTAEQLVADFLATQHGHTVIAQNFRTSTSEIDLVSILDQTIYFTEVKYRNRAQTGSAIEQVTRQKLSRMHAGANEFLEQHPEYNNFTPLLAVAGVAGQDFILQDWFVLD